jgi:PKD repeat protein
MPRFISFFVLISLCTFAASAEEPEQPLISPRCNVFTFDSSASKNPDNKTLTYLWDFGDGQTSTESVAEHIYAKAGDYVVNLSVTDNTNTQCSAAVTSQRVRAIIPPQANFASEEKACVDQTLTFDASPSRSNNAKALNYSWTFGDGTTDNKKIVKKTFSKAGKYNVSLKVDNGEKARCNEQTVEKKIFINEPPVAEAGASEILKCVEGDNGLTVEFHAGQFESNDAKKVTYTWDFGDGTKSEGMNVSHTYKDLGSYDAKLIVKDDSQLACSTAIDFVSVRLNKAPKADAGEDISACTGQELIFDGSHSFTSKKGTANASWDFGNGEKGEGLKTSYRYVKAGVYDATLNIEDQLNPSCPTSSDIRKVTVHAAPAVSIKAVTSACTGAEVEFSAETSDTDPTAVEYYWNFGDGTVLRQGSNVRHAYTQGGEYRVSVIVDDKKGLPCSSATAEMQLSVNTAPKADIRTNDVCCVSVPAEFNASSSSDPDGQDLSYQWDFSDGTSSKDVIADHQFTKSGTYNVTLTVDDGTKTSCSSATATFKAEVNTSPIPVITVR